MEKPINISENVSELLTNKRFELGYAEVKGRLAKLKAEGLIDEKQFDKITDEDILLKIKYNSYKKCVRQIIIGLILVGVGFGLMDTSPVRYLFIVGGIILSISSFFGVLSNKLTKIQKAYLK